MYKSQEEAKFEGFVRENPATAQQLGADWALAEIRRLRRLIAEASHRIEALKDEAGLSKSRTKRN